MFQIMQVELPKKNVERAATGSAYDVVRTMPVGMAFFVPCPADIDLDKHLKRVSSSCIRIASEANVCLKFRTLDAETAGALFGDAAMVCAVAGEVDTVQNLEKIPVAGVGVWRMPGEYNRRGPRSVAVDPGNADVAF